MSEEDGGPGTNLIPLFLLDSSLVPKSVEIIL